MNTKEYTREEMREACRNNYNAGAAAARRAFEAAVARSRASCNTRVEGRMADTPDFLAEDYAFTADLLRKYINLDDQSLFRAVCSNNLNVILAALDEATETAELVEALVSSDEAAVPPKAEDIP